MRIGGPNLRHVTLQSVSATQDSRGAPIDSVTTLATNLPAVLVQQTGREFLAAETIASEQRTVWRIYFRDDVDRRSRVIYDGVTYDVRDVREIGRRQYLELHTEAVV